MLPLLLHPQTDDVLDRARVYIQKEERYFVLTMYFKTNSTVFIYYLHQ